MLAGATVLQSWKRACVRIVLGSMSHSSSQARHAWTLECQKSYHCDRGENAVCLHGWCSGLPAESLHMCSCTSVCIHAGEWVCLKNVHLVVAWLPLLEKALRGLTPHPSFRLLLTSEPHPDFPPSLLEACLKVPHPIQLVLSCLLVLTEQGAQDRPPTTLLGRTQVCLQQSVNPRHM